MPLWQSCRQANPEKPHHSTNGAKVAIELPPLRFLIYPKNMKTNIIEEIKSLFEQSKSWARLELEYLKLTLAEKVTILMSALILGFVCLLMAVVVLIMLAFSLAELFKDIMCPALAYLSTAGSILVLLLLLFAARKPLLLNPLARLMTRVILDKKH